MHICLPDTREVKPAHGSAYLLYNVHIDGLYHCSLRFKQLLHLHQALSKKFTPPHHQLPPFPPKRLLTLSGAQVEERRMQLEKYLQNISQDKAISNSSIFNLFLLEAQKESTRIRENQVHLDIELVNGQKLRLQIMTHDSADTVLTAACRALGLNDRYHAFFCLCLCGYDVIRDKLIIKRRLSFFESPYVTLQMAIQQQEQLQNVLSNSYSLANTNNNNNNNNGNKYCYCQSCSNQQQFNSTATTGVPLVGSSSDSTSSSTSTTSYNIISNQHQSHYNNSYQHHHQYNGNQQTVCNQQQTSNRPSVSNNQSSTSPFVTHRILLRKSYWDPIYDTYILNDRQALNLLFIQTVYDIKHSLMFVNRETYHQLESLLASDSKMEYILLARTLKYYNYVHFEPCLSDYPRPRTKVMISIGSKELNMRVLKSPKAITSSSPTNDNTSPSSTAAGSAMGATTTSQVLANNQQVSVPSEQILYCTSSLVPSGYHHLITKDDLVEEEYNFKVPLIRCWRLTSLETLNNNIINSSSPPRGNSNNVKRKSLSLFNSVVGSISNNENRFINYNNHEPNHHHHHNNLNLHGCNLIGSGIGGTSLLAALTGSGNTCRTRQNSYHHQYCQHENQRCEPLDQAPFSQYELSFEYLVSKDTLKWITISSDQAIFISISLQGVVDELVSKRDGLGGEPPISSSPSPTQSHYHRSNSDNSNSNNVSTQNQSFTYLYRDGSQKLISANNQQLIDKFGTTLGYSPTNPYALALARQRQQVRNASTLLSTSASSSRLSSLASTYLPDTSGSYNQQHSQASASSFEIPSFKKAPSPIINDAFEGVTNDDDL